MNPVRPPKCASCGESLRRVEGLGVSVCGTCGQKNLVIQEPDCRVTEIETRFSGVEARRIAADFLAGSESVDSEFLQILETRSLATLYFVPFRESEGLAVNRHIIRKNREKHPLDTRIQFQEFHYADTVIDDPGWGLNGLRMKPDAERIFVNSIEMQRRGIVLSDTISKDTIDRQHELSGTRDVTTSREIIYRTDGRVFVPVWRITAQFKEQIYEAFVSADSGRCLKASAPQSLDRRILIFSASFALTAFLTSGMVMLARTFYRMSSPDMTGLLDKLNIVVVLMSVPMTILLIVMAALAGLGWDRLRYRTEIIKSEKSILVHATGRFGDSWLDRLHGKLLQALSRDLEQMTGIHE